MSDRLTPEREAEIAERAATLNSLGLPGGTWTASPRDEKSVFPPEMAHVVEDVLRTKHSLMRSSVGVFGDAAHAEFVAHAREDIDDLLAELAAVRAENAELEQAAAKLASLEAYGVDSWEGYDDARAAVRDSLAEGAGR